MAQDTSDLPQERRRAVVRPWLPCVALALGLAPSTALAQRPARDAPPMVPAITSLGQPPLWEPYVLGFFGTERDETRGLHAGIGGGIHRAVGSRIAGVLGISGESFLVFGDRARVGVRGLAVSRALSLGVGMEYAVGDRHVEPMVMWNTAVR